MSTVSTCVTRERSESPSFLGFVLAATIVLWASAFVGIRVAVLHYAPGPLALLRFSVATMLLSGYMLANRRLRPLRQARARDWAGFLALGLTGIVVYQLALNTGERTVSAGAASLLVNTTPLFTVLLAAALLGDRLNRRGIVGMGIAFAGAALVSLSTGEGVTLERGALWILLAAVAQAVHFIVQKDMLRRFGALELTVASSICGCLLLAAFTPALMRTVIEAPRSATLVALYLGVGPTTIGYLSWAYVVSRIPVSRAVSFLYLVPAFAFLIGWILLAEQPTLLSVLGGAATIAGVALVHRR